MNKDNPLLDGEVGSILGINEYGALSKEEKWRKEKEEQRKLELRRQSMQGHIGGVERTAKDGTVYTTAPCGAWVRITKKLNNTSVHNNSVRRRYAKGKF